MTLICFGVFSALVCVRQIGVFTWTNAFANAMIILTIILIIGSGIHKLSDQGSLLSHVPLFVPEEFSLSLGVSLFAYEGIGTIIPLYDLAADKKAFPRIVSAVIFSVMALFIIFG